MALNQTVDEILVTREPGRRGARKAPGPGKCVLTFSASTGRPLPISNLMGSQSRPRPVSQQGE